MPFGDIHIGKYWNASTNVPFLRSSYGTPGDAYIVSVAGSTLLNGINVWNVGDLVVYGLDGWLKLDGGGGGLDTTIFPSISAASSAIIPAATTFVFTASYTAGTGKGGALYLRTGSDPGHNFHFTALDENGVLGHFVGAALKVNPWMLGGTGNGIASDSTALMDCFALAAFGYKTIDLSNGQWNHDDPTKRVQIYKEGTPLTNVSLVGDSWQACKLFIPESTVGGPHPLVIRNVDGIDVRGVYFDSPTNVPSYGLEMMNCTNITVERNFFDGSSLYALGIYEDSIAITTVSAVQSGVHKVRYFEPVGSLIVEKVVTISVAGVITFIDPPPITPFTYGKIVTFVTTGALPLPFAILTTYEVISILSGTTFTVAIGPVACDNLVVRNNNFKNTGVYAIEHFPKVASNGCEVHDNIFDGVLNGYDPGNVNAPYAIKAGQCTKKSRIYNNIIYCDNVAKSSGIAIGNYVDLEVFGNTIYDYNYSAIGISAIQHAITPLQEYSYLNIRDNTLIFSAAETAKNNTVPSIGFGADAATLAYMGPVFIENNKIFNDPGQKVISVTPTGATQSNVKILRNEFYSDVAAQIVIEISNSLGGTPNLTEIKGNLFYNTNAAAAIAGRVDITGASSTIISDNKWVNPGRNVILMTSPAGENIIRNNTFDGPNVDNTAGVAIIQVNSAVASTNYIDTNTVRTGSGFPKALIGCTTGTPVFVPNGNLLDNESILIRQNATPTLSAGALKNFVQYGEQRHYWGTAAPGSGGPFVVGDICWNTAPTATVATIGWICVVAGSPGTWSVLAQVQQDIQVFTGNGTWTKPPWARIVDVEIIGGGSGGGSGASGDNSLARGGGGGGSAGMHMFKRFVADDLTGTVAVTIGGGGAGGAAVTGGAGAGSSGLIGTSGGSTTFAGFLVTRQTGGGGAGTTAGGAGGTGSAYPAIMLANAIFAVGTGTAGTTAAGGAGIRGIAAGGGAGGAGLLAAAGAGNAGAIGGAGASGAGTGILESTSTSGGGGGAAGAAGTSGVAGGAGGAGTNRVSPYFGDGGSSGGSGFPVATTSGGGNGGAGGNFGAGGGGGGAGRDGFPSGAGGAGAGGMCIVRTYG